MSEDAGSGGDASPTAIMHTNYREQGVRKVVNYIDKEHGVENRQGQPLSEEQRERFIEKSEEYEFNRLITLSPENGTELSDEELSLSTRRTMSGFVEDRPSADYVYAIHRDTEHDHTMVALTGTREDLYMDREDCTQLREQAQEQFLERGRHRGRGLEPELNLEAELEPERELERSR
jgi:hypothetical protein